MGRDLAGAEEGTVALVLPAARQAGGDARSVAVSQPEVGQPLQLGQQADHGRTPLDRTRPGREALGAKASRSHLSKSLFLVSGPRSHSAAEI